MREREKTLGAGRLYQPSLRAMENSRSTYKPDAHAELSVLIAALSEESRQKVMAFFDRKMSSSSYGNGRKAGLLEAALKRDTASAASTERA